MANDCPIGVGGFVVVVVVCVCFGIDVCFLA